MKKIFFSLLIAVSVLSLASAKAVKRGGAGDLTPYLSETDCRAICKDIVGQIIKNPRVEKFEEKNGRAPIVTIGKIKDQTGEFFDTQIIANSLKTAVLNSGVLEFMANSDVRNEMRDEVISQQDHAAEDQAKELDQEDAADYMITGSVKLMVQNNGKKQERTYIVNIELTDLKTHRTVAMFEPSEETKDYLKKTASVKSK
ncbi:MAG: penicillin-binding protein activator LpoB [Treponema sp.]|nr:penicillin-binding protein activator LpoB [Treponema sp.]MEE3435632.1 penicillin-binding protein activator LpoB [Treponema sp.]